MRGWPAALLLFLLAVACGADRVNAQPLAAERVLSLREGPSGMLTQTVVRDRDGFLWAGSSEGLDRWDGLRVRHFEVPGGVRRLAAGPDGAVWVVGFTGHLFRVASPGDAGAHRLAEAGAPDGPLGSHVRTLLPDDHGGAYVGTVGYGLVHVRPARLRYRRMPGADSVLALVRPAPEWLWGGTEGGVVRWHLPSGRAIAGARLGAVVACAVAAPGAGTPGVAVWCATRDGRLHALDARARAVGAPVETGTPVAALEASRARPGLLWIGTRGRGLLALDTATGTLGPALAVHGPDHADAFAVRECAHGLLWVGTTGGVFRADARPPPFTPGAPLDDAPRVSALHVPRSAPGVLWLGTVRAGLHRFDRASGARRTWTGPPGSPLSVIMALHTDARGKLWLAGPGPALHAFDPATGRTEPLALLAPENTVVYHLAPDPQRADVLWAGHTNGLTEVDVAVRSVLHTWLPATGTTWHSAPDADRPHEVRWAASERAGLVRLDLGSGRAQPVGGACGLGAGINAVAPVAGGVVWASRKDALVRYDAAAGRCRTVAPDDGRAPDFYGLHVDARGRVWATTASDGLFRYDPASATWTRYTTADGLPSNEYFIPSHTTSPTGEWLVGGAGGWTAFRPEAIGARGAAPRVALTALRVAGRPTLLPGERALRLGSAQNDLALTFAALDLQQPAANRYRVRLERGDDPDAPWTALGATAEVRLPFLAPGRYRLRVAGAGPEGHWGEAPPLAFAVVPPWWQRPWAWALGMLLIAGAVGLWQQGRIRQLRREEATRRRIADDLHDDIGSKMSTVALRLDLAGRSDALGDADRARLAEIARTARGVVVSLRDAVWLVDAGHDGLDALADRIETAARATLDGRPLSVERTGALPALALPMETRRHILLWAREALNNAAKHSEGRVRLGLAATAATLTLTVEDDGPGFDPVAGAGRGLKTLVARAEAVGGTHTLQTAPGAGTRMALTVPLAAPRPPHRRKAPQVDRLV